MPECIMQFMNLVINVLLYKGSGSVSRLGTSLRLGILKCLLLHRRVRTMHRWGQEVWSERPIPDIAIRIWDRVGMNPSPSRGYLARLY